MAAAETVTVTGEDDYWALSFTIPTDGVLEYTVANERSPDHAVDVLVFAPAEFEAYEARVAGAETSPRAVASASAEGVRRSVHREATLDPGKYHLVLDNTAFGEAGDWGTGATRRVSLRMDVRPA